MAQDWAASKLRDEENSWKRLEHREEQLKTAGFFKRLKINSAQFIDDFGALLIPCGIVFGGIAHAVWRAFFS